VSIANRPAGASECKQPPNEAHVLEELVHFVLKGCSIRAPWRVHAYAALRCNWSYPPGHRHGGTVPERLADRMVEPFNLTFVKHPALLPEVAINVFWHAKFHKAPANQWLRSVVFDLFSD
jgi:hypothetical protein